MKVAYTTKGALKGGVRIMRVYSAYTTNEGGGGVCVYYQRVASLRKLPAKEWVTTGAWHCESAQHAPVQPAAPTRESESWLPLHRTIPPCPDKHCRSRTFLQFNCIGIQRCHAELQNFLCCWIAETSGCGDAIWPTDVRSNHPGEAFVGCCWSPACKRPKSA